MASPSNLKATSFLFLVTLIQFQSFGQYFLPLVQPWKGRSQELIVGKNDPWITPAEKAEFKTTPSYAETLLFLKLLSQKSSQIQLRELGKTAIGQPLFAVLVSKEGKGNPIDFSKTGRPTLMVQAGIHSGEIDGKDAGLMLLRDIALGKKPGLLDKVNLIFIPILNVDGHEKPSPFNRPNRRGRENAGLRTDE
ncbi:MAG TPA: M14 family zinc carboxypeptidase, partial [Catalimonadaceae bacterium]|nr:M14 family zinc carboxypeptidase [Catalimonadaceae bacterium]